MMQLHWFFLLCVIYLDYLAVPITSQHIEFIILHNNDMHGRFDQTGVKSGTCSPEAARRNKCYGGFARVAYIVRKYRKEAKEGGLPVFYLNAGDTYTGTAWFTIFKDKIASAFLNKLQPDAISLGNHEFDERVRGLIPYLNEVNFPVLACNLDLTQAPQLKATKHLAHSTVLETKGTKIGVIGYVTPDSKKLAHKMEVEFYEEVESINAEAKLLKDRGIRIIIALGHSGYQKDQEIARDCPEVDIVVGGHTNTFLYNGAQPDAEPIEGPYPTMVKQKSGKEVPVVQAFAYTKYMGRLTVQFDAAGNLIRARGSPILLNAAVGQEQDVLDLLEVYRPNVTRLEKTVIGTTRVELEGSAKVCRAQECNLGNLLADSMVFSRMMEEKGGEYWTDAAIALMPGGGVRSSIEERSNRAITESDVLTVLPWSNDLYVTTLNGSSIRRALEHGLSCVGKDSDGGFLQLSGIHVVFDEAKPKGQGVVSVQVRCASCHIPAYSALRETESYKVIVPEFLLVGGDGYDIFQDIDKAQRLEKNDKEAACFYLKERHNVNQGLEDRIVFTGLSSGLMASTALLLISSLLVLGI